MPDHPSPRPESRRFNDWRLDDGRMVRLVTLEELDTLPDGTVLTAISGKVVTKGRDKIDRDIRFGYTAFGFVLGEKSHA